jgi:Na+-driven multidrug efflux pump
VSGLIGERKIAEAELVVTDLFRLGIITMIFVAGAFWFAAKPLLIFLGCADNLADDGRAYLTPILIAMPLITTFQLACGFLQSEGRSVLCGAMQFVGFALNCGLLAPFMLKVLHVGLRLAGVSFAVSQACVGIGLTIAIYLGKFNLKPKLRDWIGPFHKSSFHAMLLALPFLVNVLASSLPPMMVLKLLMSAAEREGVSHLVGVVFPVFIKLNSAINSVSIGLCQGFLGAGSYAFSSGNGRRHLELMRAVCVLGFCYHLLFMPIMIFKPQWLARIWLSKKDELDWARKLLRVPYFTNTLIPLNFAMVNFLLSTKSPMISLLLTLIRGGLFIGYSYLCYNLLGKSSEHMMYAYNMDDVTLFILGLIAMIGPFKKVLKMVSKLPPDSYASMYDEV